MDDNGVPPTPSTARPGGRLRRVPGGRHRTVFLRLSEEEELVLVPRAAALGVSVQRLLVESAMAGGPAPAAERRALYRVLQQAARDVHGVAVNLNQMARWGNEHRQVPDGLRHTADRFDAAQARLAAVAGELVARLSTGAQGAPE